MTLYPRPTSWLHLFHNLFLVRLPPEDVRTAVLSAAAFNVLGMPLALVMLRNSTAPIWPEFFSIGVGLIILGFSYSAKTQTARLPSLFVLNATAVSFALYFMNAYEYAPGFHGTPFQASKLGTLVASLLAPGFLSGLLAICIHAGSSVFQFLFYPMEIQAAMGDTEPWAIIAFGLAGFVTLIYRFRVTQLLEISYRAQSEAETEKKLASSFLELRDLMNTPLQSIEISATLLKEKGGADPELLRLLQASCEKLRKLNDLLKKYEEGTSK